MKIRSKNQPREVQTLFVLIYGQPGVMKTSLANSARNALSLNTDHGDHRACILADDIYVTSWQEIVEVSSAGDELDAYNTIVIDTGGRAIDFLADMIMRNDIKMKNNKTGGLTLQGYGALKNNFQQFINQLRTKGKDVVMVCHAKEEKQDENTVFRPDLIGGSYDEVMKQADMVGYMYFDTNGKVSLQFNPTLSSVGKNPAGFDLIQYETPLTLADPNIMENLIDRAKESLSAMNEEQLRFATKIEEMKTKITSCKTPEDFEVVTKEMSDQEKIIQAQLRSTFRDALHEANVQYSKDKRCYEWVPGHEPQESKPEKKAENKAANGSKTKKGGKGKAEAKDADTGAEKQEEPEAKKEQPEAEKAEQ